MVQNSTCLAKSLEATLSWFSYNTSRAVTPKRKCSKTSTKIIRLNLSSYGIAPDKFSYFFNTQFLFQKHFAIYNFFVIDDEAITEHCKSLTWVISFDHNNEEKFHQHQPTCKYSCERCHQQLDTILAIGIHVIARNGRWTKARQVRRGAPKRSS